jgi:hypothetical protein
MSHFAPRSTFFPSVLTLPATKTAGAFTYSSAVFQMSQNVSYSAVTGSAVKTVLVPGNAYKTEVTIRITDRAQITDTFTLNLMGSWDGTTYVVLAAYANIANGSGAISVKNEVVPAHANFFRLDLVSNGTGALATGHGIGVDFTVMEDPVQNIRANYQGSAVHAAVAATYTQLSGSTTYGPTLTFTGNSLPYVLPNGTTRTDVLNLNKSVQKLYITAATVGTPIATQNGALVVQGSMDGVNWYSVALTNTAFVFNAATILVNEVTAPTGAYVGNFFRVGITTGTGAITCSGANYFVFGVSATY